MTTFEKSKLLWIGGGIVGGLAGYFAAKTGKTPLGPVAGTLCAAALGSIVVGAIGDAVLEQEQRTGVFSLLPLGR